MANGQEKVSSLPTVSSSTTSDVIYAIQAGISVQQTLAQVLSLNLSNIVLYNSGDPNGSIAGTTYQFCWDTLGNNLYICTLSGTALTATWTTVSASYVSNFVSVTGTSASMVQNTTYQANNSSLVTLTLPTTAAVGSTLSVLGYGTGGWIIDQGSSQSIIFGNITTTVDSGSISSTNQYDTISMICVVANTTWQVISDQGNLTVI